MRKVTVAAVQMSCAGEREENIEKALFFSGEAAARGAGVILLPELFERPYFCQERDYSHYDFAEALDENAAVKKFLSFSGEKNVVALVSFYERDGVSLYNSCAVMDCGKVLGVYRKTHIPDDHYYQEKFYFTPGNTGFRVFDTSKGKIGVGICWDQWFPETARALALGGAELIFYPTAIGSEPILGVDSSGHWRRVMQGHAAANLVPVIAANRVGTEKVVPTKANGGQCSSLDFYGSSFVTDLSGEIMSAADRTSECVIFADFDLDECAKERTEWGLFRDRRPEMYGVLTGNHGKEGQA
ncbi:MAG: N-carbamoylputrescine amidase [Clostridia bacterium]|nr:N-carbamoylputrescine amidase [Clostridia bacterium]